MKMNKNERGVAHLAILLVVLALVVGFATWRVVNMSKSSKKSDKTVSDVTTIVPAKIETVAANGTPDALLEALNNEVVSETSNEEQSVKSEQSSANSVTASDVSGVGDIQNEITL